MPGNECRLFERGTRLKDVPPDFRGISLAEWRRTWMREQCDAYLESLGTTDARNRAYVEQHGRTRSVFSPRDSYGMKSI